MGGSESAPRTLTVHKDGECDDVVTVPVTSAVSRAVSEPIDNKSGSAVDECNENFFAPNDEKLRQYQERIKSLEKQNAELFGYKLHEFAKSVSRVEEKYLKTTEPVVCADVQSAVIRCYADNARESLRCAEKVRAFNDCTRRYHQMVGSH